MVWLVQSECVNFTSWTFLTLFLWPFSWFLFLRFHSLAASHLPYFLTILTTTCALLIKRYSAPLHMLRFPLPMKSTSTWENLKASSSVQQVATFYGWFLCTFHSCFLWMFIHCLFVVLPWYPEYCGTFCYPNVPQSPYLHTVGEKLLPGIDVLWTGEFKAHSVFSRLQ